MRLCCRLTLAGTHLTSFPLGNYLQFRFKENVPLPHIHSLFVVITVCSSRLSLFEYDYLEKWVDVVVCRIRQKLYKQYTNIYKPYTYQQIIHALYHFHSPWLESHCTRCPATGMSIKNRTKKKKEGNVRPTTYRTKKTAKMTQKNYRQLQKNYRNYIKYSTQSLIRWYDRFRCGC